MKRFDSAAIKERLISRIRINANWAILLEDGTITNLIDVISEGNAELARYAEYLLLEKKWLTASNMTSLTHMADLISAKRSRKKSASGYVIVSHTDVNGVNRLAELGKSYFKVTDPSNYDDITPNPDKTYTFSETRALVPWTYSEPYTIPIYTKFFTSDGKTFFSTEQIKSRILKEPYSVIRANPNKYEEFLLAGGWEGIKYVRVPVIEGTIKETTLGFVKGMRFETFVINSVDVEAASNSISNPFFKIELELKNGIIEPWTEITNIRLAGPYDKVYETSILQDNSGIKVKFGDGITGMMPNVEALIRCRYLETSGLNGNVEYKYKINRIAFPTGISMIDPRTNFVSSFLSATNITGIMGGKDLQTEDEFKAVAPTSYLSSYTTATIKVYEEQIMNNSAVNLLNIRCYPITEITAQKVVSEENEDLEVYNELGMSINYLGITAILANGNKIEDPENSFILPLTKSLGNVKGPNDVFKYYEPDFIKLAVSVIIKTKDPATNENMIKEDVALQIFNKYSIFMTDFMKPFYASDIIHIATGFKYTEYANHFIEALANTSYKQNDIHLIQVNAANKLITDTVNSDTLVAIPFSFDKIFVTKQTQCGFKNFEHDAQYLLKVDLKFKNGTTENNRTLFLYDNRDIVNNVTPTLENAKELVIDNNGIKPIITSIITDDILGKYSLFNEQQDGYDNRQVRVAQYTYISKITSNEFMVNAKNYSKDPFELRPLITDNNGINKIFNSDDIPVEEQVALAENAVVGDLCYRRNTKYFNYLDIVFNETKDVLNPPSGWVVLSLDYLNFTETLRRADADIVYEALENLLENTIDIKVYAQPLLTEIIPTEENNIVFVDLEDIKVEKNTSI
jgi:hypothetical protein